MTTAAIAAQPPLASSDTETVKGALVRIHTKGRPSEGGQHYGRARLLEFGPKRSLVQPMGHKQPIAVETEHLHPWKSRNDGPVGEALERLLHPGHPGDAKPIQTFDDAPTTTTPSPTPTPKPSPPKPAASTPTVEAPRVPSPLPKPARTPDRTPEPSDLSLDDLLGLVGKLREKGADAVRARVDAMRDAEQEMRAALDLWCEERRAALDLLDKLAASGARVEDVDVPDAPDVQLPGANLPAAIARGMDLSSTEAIGIAAVEHLRSRRGEWLAAADLWRAVGATSKTGKLQPLARYVKRGVVERRIDASHARFYRVPK